MQLKMSDMVILLTPFKSSLQFDVGCFGKSYLIFETTNSSFGEEKRRKKGTDHIYFRINIGSHVLYFTYKFSKNTPIHPSRQTLSSKSKFTELMNLQNKLWF